MCGVVVCVFVGGGVLPEFGPGGTGGRALTRAGPKSVAGWLGVGVVACGLCSGGVGGGAFTLPRPKAVVS